MRPPEGVSPEAELLGWMLRLAIRDAARGDIRALAWLVTTGADIADSLKGGARHEVLRFCNEIKTQVGRGELAHGWGIDIHKNKGE